MRVAAILFCVFWTCGLRAETDQIATMQEYRALETTPWGSKRIVAPGAEITPWGSVRYDKPGLGEAVGLCPASCDRSTDKQGCFESCVSAATSGVPFDGQSRAERFRQRLLEQKKRDRELKLIIAILLLTK